MSDDEWLDYASSGVDIDLEGEAIASLIGSLGVSARPPGTVGAPVDLPGGFGGHLFEARVTVTAEIHMRVLGGRVTDRFMSRCEIIGSDFVALEFDD